MGKIAGIAIASRLGAPMVELQRARLIAGRGIEGDRYTQGLGSWKKKGLKVSEWPHSSKRQLSLIAYEALVAVAQEGYDFHWLDTRREILTMWENLNALIGSEFTIGEVRCRGVELCEPCERPSKLCGKPGFKEAFTPDGRCGILAEIIEGGEIHVGDLIEISHL